MYHFVFILLSFFALSGGSTSPPSLGIDKFWAQDNDDVGVLPSVNGHVRCANGGLRIFTMLPEGTSVIVWRTEDGMPVEMLGRSTVLSHEVSFFGGMSGDGFDFRVDADVGGDVDILGRGSVAAMTAPSGGGAGNTENVAGTEGDENGNGAGMVFKCNKAHCRLTMYYHSLGTPITYQLEKDDTAFVPASNDLIVAVCSCD